MSIYDQESPRKRGPRFKLSAVQCDEVHRAYLANEQTVDEIASLYKVTKQTIYNVIKRIRQAKLNGKAARP